MKHENKAAKRSVKKGKEEYQPPHLVRHGTLAELTRGAFSGSLDDLDMTMAPFSMP